MNNEPEPIEKRQFKGIWIPANIWLRTDIKAAEKVLYAEIECFTGAGRAYYRSNEATAAFLGVGLASVKRYIKHLRELGLIERRFDGRNRSLAALGQKLAKQTAQNEPVEAQNEPVEAQNEPHRIQVDNSTENKEKKMRYPSIAKRVLSYLNREANHRYKFTDSNLALIIDRLKEGYTEEDCQHVIDAMLVKANGDSFWRDKITTTTPFRPKNFPRYLDWWAPPSKEKKPMTPAEEAELERARKAEILLHGRSSIPEIVKPLKWVDGEVVI